MKIFFRILGFIIIMILLSIKLAKADNLKFNIGINSIYINDDNSNSTYLHQYEGMKNLTIGTGFTYIFDNKLVLNISTNRLYHPETKRNIITNNGTNLENRNKITTDSFAIGYSFNKFIPSIFAAHVKDKENFYYNEQNISTIIKTDIVYGINLTYFLTKEISGMFFILAPNKKLNIENSFGIGINYNFDLL